MTVTSGAPARLSFDDASALIIRVGVIAHGYGSSTVQLETYLSRLLAALGYQGVIRTGPTELLFAIQEEGSPWQRLHLAERQGGSLDLDKLARLGELVDELVAGRVSPHVAAERLDEIAKRPNPWGRIATAAGYAACGAGLATVLGGGWLDVLFGTLLAVLVYGMVLWAKRSGSGAGEWLPFSSAFVVATIATAATSWISEPDPFIVTIAAIAVLIPGYVISLGISELVEQRVVSGTSNLVAGLVYLVKQVVGAWIGFALVQALMDVPTAGSTAGLDQRWELVFVPLLIVGLVVTFQTAPRDMLWAAAGCVLAYGTLVIGTEIASAELGTLLGSLLVVMYANLWGWFVKRPVTIVLIPAVILLVSGSIGFQGLAAIAAGQTTAGTEQFLQMFWVALLIVAGSLVGNTLVRPTVTL